MNAQLAGWLDQIALHTAMLVAWLPGHGWLAAAVACMLMCEACLSHGGAERHSLIVDERTAAASAAWVLGCAGAGVAFVSRSSIRSSG